MNEIRLDEKSHIPERKAFKDNFTNTLYKRPFSIEKIKKDLNRIKNYNSRTSNNQDKHLLELRKKLKEKVMKEYSSNEKMPLSKNLDNLYRFIKKINNNNLNIKSIKSRGGIIPAKKKFNRQRSDFDLPMISSRKLRKQLIIRDNSKNMSLLNDYFNSKEQENIIHSEIMGPKEMFKNNQRTIKISSFVNTSKVNDIPINNEPKLYDINEINEKFNLKLNLSNVSKPPSKIFQGRKYTILGMLNKLFEYYSSENTHNFFPSNSDYQTSNYINYSKSNNSILLNNDTHYIKNDNNNNMNKRNNDIKNKFSNRLLIESKMKSDQSNSSEINIINKFESSPVEDTNTFLTKLAIDNRSNNNKSNLENEVYNKRSEDDITKLINNRSCLDDITIKNKEIMKNNTRVYIDCLMSKIEQNINIKKILYKYLGKSIHQLEKDPSYLRLKELEKKIIAILKEK